MIAIYLFYFITLFANLLKEQLTLINFWDEVLVILSLCLFCFVSLILSSQNRHYKLDNWEKVILCLIVMLILWSLLPNLFSTQAKLPLQLFSLFGLLKFILFYLTAKPVIIKENLYDKRQWLISISYGYSLVSVLFYGANFFVPVLKPFDHRLGMSSYAFGFEHPAQFSTAIIMMTIITAYIKGLENKGIPYGLLLVNFGLVVIAGRTTSITFYLLMTVVLISANQFKKIPLTFYGGLVLLVSLVARERIVQQFMGSTREARGILMRTATTIAQDKFPFGVGLGRFGSQAARQDYSSVYREYRMSNYWGMTPKNPMFLTDSYWAMVLGETNWLGVLIMLSLIVCMGLSIRKSLVYQQNSHTAYLLLPLFYGVFTSPVDTVFVSNSIILIVFSTLMMLNFNHYFGKAQPNDSSY